MRLTTRRLILREFTAEDWPAVLAYQSDPRYLRYYHWERRDARDVREFVQTFLDQQASRPRLAYQLALTLTGSGTLIGNCGIRQERAGSRVASLGYEIAPDYWGRGLATEAAQAMLRFGFQSLKLHRVWASVIAENRGSIRVLEKVGMCLEGRLREQEWMKGRRWDTLIYAILASEWAEAVA